MKTRICLALAAVLCLTGCVIVTPSDQALISSHYQIVQALDARVQADATIPPYMQQAWHNEAAIWANLSAWASGVAPASAPVAPATQPVK